MVGILVSGSPGSFGSGAKPILISSSSGSETKGIRGDEPPGESPGWGLRVRIMGVCGAGCLLLVGWG